MRVRPTSLLLVLLTAAALVPGAWAAEFVGSESCRSCHEDAYKAWEASGHAKAHRVLTPAQRKDARCTQCHAPDEAAGGEPGVSCETCHGAGEHYWPDYVMRDAELSRATGLVMPGAQACLLCHDASSPSLEKFDPAKAMARIDHWTAPRAARKGKRAEASQPCDRKADMRQAKVEKSEALRAFLVSAARPPAAKAARPQ